MKLLAFCLLLGMSAQAQITTGTVKLAQLACNRNVETGEITPKECTQAAQRAADETDGKPLEYPWGTEGNGGDGGHLRLLAPKPEPVDVPAVQKWREIDFSCMAPSLGRCTNSDCTDAWCVPRKEKQRYYTCADKSRVLLTSEDGKKHCIKF